MIRIPEEMKDYKDYTFHGVPCDQVTFATWMEQRNRGECPFCHRRLVARYNNTKRHIKACPNKPKIGPSNDWKEAYRQQFYRIPVASVGQHEVDTDNSAFCVRD